jgi:putative CRISPR-associated protein (TIGR02619 family)
MKATLLITCGASLLTNALKDTKSSDKLRKYGLDKIMSMNIGSIEYEKVRGYAYKGHEVFQILLDYIKADSIKASAELNTLELFLSHHKLLYSDVKIYLYRSDTSVGLLIANVLEHYLQEKGSIVSTIEVKGFGTAKTLNEFQEGMVDLMTKIIRVTKGIKANNSKGKVYVLASGGFKPETTAAVIAALLAQADGIYYVYEHNRELVAIPAIPLAINHNALDLLDKIFHIKDSSKRRWSISIDELLAMGIDTSMIDELEFMGLVNRKGELQNKLEIREWVKELLSN